MIKLVNVSISKYKSINTKQEVSIQDKITTLVGMNESGKTVFLEALAKVNYFIEDDNFKFDVVQDYPRSQLKAYQKSGEDSEVVRLKYSISPELLNLIAEDLGKGTFVAKFFEYSSSYNNKHSFVGIESDNKSFLKFKIDQFKVIGADKDIISKIENLEDFKTLEAQLTSENGKTLASDIIENILAEKYSFEWTNRLDGHIAKKWIKPNLPKFWYYDEYYALPSRIDINVLSEGQSTNDEALKTSKALFELADIDLPELLESENFESYIAELEATSNHITDQLFKYWSTNKNLSIDFKIDNVRQDSPHEAYHKVLDIRVHNKLHRISLPLSKRSKGFNWFFSFIVWFSKIQDDKKSNYVLLLDEPGLNLHASAQNDLLNYFNDLSENYQVIYSTHSPFMIDSNHLEDVRTVLETEKGTVISNSIQEKDPNTLFPLQAALGYSLAQSLFVSKNNLLVEGPTDLLYLTTISNLLESEKRKGLQENITIVPVGGLDKVATFISLLRGSKLNIVCMLDSFTDEKGKQKVTDLIQAKIIKEKNVRFFNEFVQIPGNKADIEDLFTKEEYLKIFNQAFPEYKDILVNELESTINQIIPQVCKVIGKDRFNHYRPAYKLIQQGVSSEFFSKETLDRFEKLFKEINALFTSDELKQ